MNRSTLAAIIAVFTGAVAPVPDAPTIAARTGIPARAVEAYVRAAAETGTPWQLIAAITDIESQHCTLGGRTLMADGRPDRAIYGPELGGPSWTGEFAYIKDSDQGALDGRTEWDRAVGCGQALPSSWFMYESDGDGDGRADPQDIDDSAVFTGRYLAASGDLSDPQVLSAAVLSYNRSGAYRDEVLTQMDEYAQAWPGGAQVGDAGDLWLKVGRVVDELEWPWLHRQWDHVARRMELVQVPTTTSSSPTGELVTVQGITVDASMAAGLEQLLSDARQAGFRLGGSGWRSTAEQEQLRVINGCPDVYSSPASSCRVMTAIPGRSLHEQGLAVDFYEITGDGAEVSLSPGAAAWLHTNGPRYGFHFAIDSEPWHGSATGG